MSNEKILLVEDSPLNRRLIEAVLKPRGFQVLTAEDGRQGIDLAMAELPDLILMDVQLPEVSGYDATRILKSRPETRHIPIVALTAHAMADERDRAIAAGCDGYITKPIDTRQFPDQIRQYLSPAPKT
jgi:two-component system cell cycle response regulator DivK